MKEHYVSYSQAVALKRLGFKEETTHYYVKFKSDGEVKLWSCNPPDNHNARLSTNEVCSAPRLDQAQKWLREKKKWHIIVEPRIWEQQVYDFKLWHYYRGYENANRGLDYLSYESALSAGIDKALELLGKEIKE
ncbi:MAG: hypothetical protein K2N88_02660 [Muribaculaceae bacterium]|nr:hypothetical protein [Muribaculaceae bacterium]